MRSLVCRFTQNSPQSVVPVGHSQAQVVGFRTRPPEQVLVQTHCPPTQPRLAPVHGVPHAPQCCALVRVLVSQPFVGLPSQSAKPGLQVVTWQAPVAGLQAPAPLATVQTTGSAPTQTPARQVSVRVQALPSSQLAPSAAFGLEQTPVSGSQVPATWQSSEAEHTTGSLPTQLPAPSHASDWVQRSPSSQAVPSGAGGLEQAPVAGLQVPARWQSSEAVQTTGLPPVQTPAWQVSVRVQASPSSQAAPSILGGLEQIPVVGLQTPMSWHWSDARQTTGVPGTHWPAPLQTSWPLQGLPSSQDVSRGFGGLEQTPVPGSQVPAEKHGPAAVHWTGVPGTQAPAWQVSSWVQAFPSLQAAPSALGGLEQVPVAGLQVPGSWHWSEAVQTTAAPPRQTPAWQVSPIVQRLPSLQSMPSGASGLEQRPVAGSHTPATWHWSSGWHWTWFDPTQAPFWQVSVRVQALPSSQAAPFGFAGLVQAPVAGSQAPARWHWSLAVQAGMQAPPHSIWPAGQGAQRPEAQVRPAQQV